ncbi:MAG: phosphoserine phosphatase RsbU/P [Clostridiales bacterium]|nr:phosphoserine phosphatase RsbU/P [Clostridiales bacterium]
MHNFSELDILKIAISSEEDGMNFYLKLYEDAKNDESKRQVFTALANEEKNHIQIFKNLYKEALDKEKGDTEHSIFEKQMDDFTKFLVHHFLSPKKDIFTGKDPNFKELINDALDQEYKSIKFYFHLAQNSRNENVQNLLHTIIKEEEQHVIKLKEMLYYNKTSILTAEHIHFIGNILNGMQDWVRVIDLEDNIIYANNAMKEALGYYIIGRKCFEVIGRTSHCSNCVSKQAANFYQPVLKEEEINGRIYSVMSSPLKNLNGEIEAVIEVLRDITQAKKMEEKIKMQNKRLKEDMEIARKMQCSLLPKSLRTDKIKFTYYYKPCEMIGGDFFDIFHIDDSHIGVYIADVSGHGVSASMLTVFLRQTIQKNKRSPVQVLRHLYHKFNENDFAQELYITMFYAVIDLERKNIRYANAGHNTLPILFNSKEISYLQASGIPISNWMEEVQYEEYSRKLNTGDRLIFFTDGITEICNPSEEMYGSHRLEECIFKNREKDIDEIKDLIIKDTYNFRHGEELINNELFDDMTLVFVEIK